MTRQPTLRCSLASRFVPRRSDRGSATVFGLAAGLGVILVGLMVAMSVTFITSRAQARTAADLAALAGAGWARAGQSVACARAAQLATANGATLVTCRVEGLDVSVTVELKGIRAVALAGPVRAGVGGADAV